MTHGTVPRVSPVNAANLGDTAALAEPEGEADATEGFRPGIVAVGTPVIRLLAVGAAWVVAVHISSAFAIRDGRGIQGIDTHT